MDDWDPRSSNLLNGPGLFKWLETRRRIRGTPHIPPDLRLNASDKRRLNQWKNGGDAEVETVDKILNKLNLILQEVPVELYQNERHGGYRPVTASVKHWAIQAYRGGMTAPEVGKTIGVYPSTVRRWANEKH